MTLALQGISRHLVLSTLVAAVSLAIVAGLQYAALNDLRTASDDVHAIARLEQLSGAMARRITLIRATLFPRYEEERSAAAQAELERGFDEASAAIDAFVAWSDNSLMVLDDERARRVESARTFVGASRERLAFLQTAGADVGYPDEQAYLALRERNLEDQERFQEAATGVLSSSDAEEGAAAASLRRTAVVSAFVLLGLFVGYVWLESVLSERRWRGEQRGRVAEQLSAHRGDMVNLASHELRNPLAVILLTAELMESAATDSGNADLAEAASDARAAALRADSIVAELLDLGRIDAERLVLNIQPVAVAPMIAEAISGATNHHGSRDVSIDCGQAMVVAADPDRLRIIIRNMIDNAFKYSAAGTKVRVAVHRQNGVTTMEVRDEGPGIAEAALEEVFSRFGRLQNTSYVSGIGIGLHLSRELARRMSGDLSARKAEGGACFVLALPSVGAHGV
ncbi:MAG: sensor histidine kinase [Dehalococcoidia bacterium]